MIAPEYFNNYEKYTFFEIFVNSTGENCTRKIFGHRVNTTVAWTGQRSTGLRE